MPHYRTEHSIPTVAGASAAVNVPSREPAFRRAVRKLGYAVRSDAQSRAVA